jgi:hypothetical protein
VASNSDDTDAWLYVDRALEWVRRDRRPDAAGDVQIIVRGASWS